MNIRLILAVQGLITLVLGRQITLNQSKDADEFLDKTEPRTAVRRAEDDINDTGDENDGEKENWVVDSIYYDDYQSDSPVMEGTYDSCPPVPDVITEGACSNNSCQSDLDCNDAYRCCYNGCAFTCLLEVQPAAVVDWKKEPRRSRSGISWLVSGPSILLNEAEPCSTAPVGSDEDPLLCPNGYFCHVERTGKSSKGKYNNGYCVKQTTEQYISSEEELIIASPLRGTKKCNVDGVLLLENASIRLKNKKCQCKRGVLSCTKQKSRRKKNKSGVKMTKKTKKSSRNTRRRKRKRPDQKQDKNKTSQA